MPAQRSCHLRICLSDELKCSEIEFAKLEILTLTIGQMSDCQLAARGGVRPERHGPSWFGDRRYMNRSAAAAL